MSELEDLPDHGLSRKEILNIQAQMNAFIDKHEHRSVNYRLGMHQIRDLEIESHFLFNRWSMTKDLEKRWQSVWESSKRLREMLIESKAGKKDIRVLDIGCGHCAYWPILSKYNVTKFTGIDLFDLTTIARVQESLGGLFEPKVAQPVLGTVLSSENIGLFEVGKVFDKNLLIPESAEVSNYFAAILMVCATSVGALSALNNLDLTHKLIKNMLPDASTRLLMSKAENFEAMLGEDEKFDIIMCAGAHPGKPIPGEGGGGKNIGVPPDLLDKIAAKHLASGGAVAHVDNV